MNVTSALFTGEHRGRPAQVMFQHVPCGWKVILNVSGKTLTLQASKNVKPCMTHARYLLDEHFPLLLDAARKPRKRNQHRASVVKSSFVEHKTGMRFRVVR